MTLPVYTHKRWYSQAFILPPYIFLNFITYLSFAQVPLPGDYMPGVPPVPIPNTAVKPRAADGSWTIGPARVSRCQVYDPDTLNSVRVFCVLGLCVDLPGAFGRPRFGQMRFQPNRDYASNDDIQTPLNLAGRIVRYFQPAGRVLEPCAGDGNFLAHLPGADWCELKKGRDFLMYEGRIDWIITNPPWSQIRPFLTKAFQSADNVVFLMTINHAWTKARLRIAKENQFGLKTIVLTETPKSFPQSGFQLGAVHYKRHWQGAIALVDLTEEP